MVRLFALLAVVLTLLGCTAAPAPIQPTAPAAAAPAPAPAPQGPLTSHVESDGYQVKFVLDGYTGATPPTITIRSVTGALWADHDSASPAGVYTLYTSKRQEAVADQLSYTWNTSDGRTVTGELLYTNPNNTQQWQITETEHLVLYHARPLAEGEAALLDDTAQRSADLVGMPLPNPRIAIFLFPDDQSLVELYGKLGNPPPVAGFSTPGYMFVRGGWATEEVVRVVAHETVHVLGSFHNYLMLAEGLPEYAAQVQMARVARETGYQYARRQLFFDNLTKLTESMKVGGAYSKIQFDAVPLIEPQSRNAYTVGCAFMLFVRSKYGDDGIQKLFSIYRMERTDLRVIASFFDETTATVQVEFNAYLKSGQALADARTLFEFPK